MLRRDASKRRADFFTMAVISMLLFILGGVCLAYGMVWAPPESATTAIVVGVLLLLAETAYTGHFIYSGTKKGS